MLVRVSIAVLSFFFSGCANANEIICEPIPEDVARVVYEIDNENKKISVEIILPRFYDSLEFNFLRMYVKPKSSSSNQIDLKTDLDVDHADGSVFAYLDISNYESSVISLQASYIGDCVRIMDFVLVLPKLTLVGSMEDKINSERRYYKKVASALNASIHKYSFSKSKAVGKFNIGNLGKFAVHFPMKKNIKEHTKAIIELDKLSDKSIMVKYIDVLIYGNQCEEKPQVRFSHGSRIYEEVVLPVSFSVAKKGCIEIKYYADNVTGYPILTDKFQVKLVK